jgi:hypothetical protein
VRLPSTPPTDSVITDGLVGWYRFEDGDARDYTAELGVGSDQTAFNGDVIGASFDPNGGVTDFSNGGQSGAFDFDGVDDQIELPAFLSSNKPFTISAFIEPVAVNSTRRVVSKFSGVTGTSKGLFVFDISNGDVRFIFFGDNNTISITGGSVPLNEKTHLAVSFDASAGKAKLFTDGVLENSSSAINSTPPRLGKKIGIAEDIPPGGAKEFFDGIIDEVRFYDRVLSEAEIKSIFDKTLP